MRSGEVILERGAKKRNGGTTTRPAAQNAPRRSAATLLAALLLRAALLHALGRLLGASLLGGFRRLLHWLFRCGLLGAAARLRRRLLRATVTLARVAAAGRPGAHCAFAGAHCAFAGAHCAFAGAHCALTGARCALTGARAFAGPGSAAAR